MRWAGALVGRGRRIAAAPEWPVAAAGLLGVAATTEVVVSGAFGPNVPAALMLALGATVPVAFARTLVLVAAVPITIATLLTVGAYGRVTGAGLLALLAVLYLLGRHRPLWVSLSLVVPFILYAIVTAFEIGGSGPAGDEAEVEVEIESAARDTAAPAEEEPDRDRRYPVVLAALAGAAVGLGGARRAHGEAAERNSSRRVVADTLLEHAARGERARIARELHDVVAHHISMISVQAETARLTTTGLPAEGAERLRAIGDTARAALTEMRRLLGVLREDAGAEPTRAPQPGLAQLIDLVDEAREAAGGSTRLIVQGRVRPLDPGLELTAYRVVQEALTNARRHAPGAAVDVELHYTEDALRVRVRDNGPGPAGPVAANSHGLLGMRERIAAVGGDLRTGPASMGRAGEVGGGFQVEAHLPAGEMGAS